MTGRSPGRNKRLAEQGSMLLEICIWMFIGFGAILLFSKISYRSYVRIGHEISWHNEPIRR
jgi:hypothetical protein